MSRISGDLYVDGNVRGKTMSIPASAITNTAVDAAADIAQTKLEHQHRLVLLCGSGAHSKRRVARDQGRDGIRCVVRCGYLRGLRRR